MVSTLRHEDGGQEVITKPDMPGVFSLIIPFALALIKVYRHRYWLQPER